MPAISATPDNIISAVSFADAPAGVCTSAMLLAVTYTFSDAWQGRRESNPQPAVLETAALPIELLPYALHALRATFQRGRCGPARNSHQAITLATTPAPTVLPPSRMA